MAVALSLLIVLPGLAQSSGFDDPEGTLSSGADLTVDVTDGDDVAQSYFNGDLYVSNDKDAHNSVRITAEPASPDFEVFNGADGKLGEAANDDNSNTAEQDLARDNAHCVIATVENVRSGKDITVGLSTADADQGDNDPTDDDAPFAGMFNVIPAGVEQEDGLCVDYTDTPVEERNEALGLIPARHGDTLRITVAGVQGSVDVTVDAEGPEFSEISPEDGVYLDSNSVKFQFVVTDEDSGLRHDGELDYTRGDLDARAFNLDDDQFTNGEPRSDANGAASDIGVVFGSNGVGEGGEDMSRYGSAGWDQRGDRAGVSYDMEMTIAGREEGLHHWYLEASDRAGNTTRTEVEDDDDRDDFRLWVDVSNPEFGSARTGISYDTGDRKEIVDRSSIAVTFTHGNRGLDDVMNIDADKFLVEGVEVVGAIQPGAASKCSGTDDPYPLDIDEGCGMEDHPQARIYLQLAEALAPDATPLVSMFGGAVLDRAGNPSSQDEITAEDFIAPTLTVTLTTAVMDRPVLRHNSEFTVAISSDEELRRAPTVWFAQLGDATESDAEKQRAPLGSSQRGGDRVVAGSEDNSWEQTYRTNDVGNLDGAYAVVVIGEDDNDNVGSTPGWANKRTDKQPIADDPSDPDNRRRASLSALIAGNLLVEIDTNDNVKDPTFELSPEAGVDTEDTESRNPYVTVSFATEANEYDKSFKGDSHSAVEIVSITLNGASVADNVSEVENNEYTVGLRDLEVGSYDLKVTGRDDVGNEVSDTYEFDVVPRDPYEIDLIPGWNLVSVPGTPLDSSVDAVMGGTNEASIVLAYQDDEWLTSVNDQGTWRGTLTDIVGGYGYWVQTTAFETISTLIPETDTSSILPTAQVIRGWNLLGVVDVAQADAGDPPSGGGEADDYFSNFNYRVAYAFETETNQWTKTLPDVNDDADGEILNGKGYWVWSTEAGTLVP